jgi:uncharacterized protein (TIGR02001 family)
MSFYRKILPRVIGPISLLILLAALPTAAQQKSEAKSDKSNKLYGEAAVVSNYVDKGVTQSDKGPALQAGFGYQMGTQARLGLWGSNVKYPSGGENLNLRFYFDVKMDFTSNTNAVFRYDLNRYFQADQHNGAIVGLDFAAFGYHAIFEMNDNWEGLRAGGSTWFGFKKEYLWTRGLVFTPQLGYTQTSVTGYTSYFDTRLGVGYRFADVTYELVHTYNSSSSQFAGRGDMAFLLAVNARF